MFKLPAFFTHRTDPELVAAVDLGSNSFHMIVARVQEGQIHILDRLREMVRLAAGLDSYNRLSDSAQERALDCLRRFGQRLRDMPSDSVRIVGTNALRSATNAPEFLVKAEKVLHHPIELIAGREEARLIYLGVVQSMAGSLERRLVIDIGGGSTEFIIGEGREPICLESLNMGCVNMSERYFADGAIRQRNLRRAEIAALLELQPIEAVYRKTGWEVAIGASGTLRSIAKVIEEMGLGLEINPLSLNKLRQIMLDAGHIDQLNLKGLSKERLPVFAGGFAVIAGIFEGLGIQKMQIAEGALREGLIYDLVGRIAHEDARQLTTNNLMTRYQVDRLQAERVEDTVLLCWSQVAKEWGLMYQRYAYLLSWGALLHEIGLSISHESYHKHGAYILIHSDLAGFSREEQRILATLVRNHRRRLAPEDCQPGGHIKLNILIRLCLLLRLAVLLHRSRTLQPLPDIKLIPTEQSLHLQFPAQWLENHSLTQADLEQEQNYLKEIDFKLTFGEI